MYYFFTKNHIYLPDTHLYPAGLRIWVYKDGKYVDGLPMGMPECEFRLRTVYP